MADIDLIPVDYREWLVRRSTLIRYGVAIVALNVAICGLAFALSTSADARVARITELQNQNAITQQQQLRLQALQDERNEYERRWSLLQGLRAGAAIDDIFSIIDATIIPGELWFLNWSFRRAGVVVAGERRGVETGYFIIVDEDPSKVNPDLSVETHMTISGQARDHQALSKFVRALFEQRDIKDVNVQRTSQTPYAAGRVVEFNLTVVLNSALRPS